MENRDPLARGGVCQRCATVRHAALIEHEIRCGTLVASQPAMQSDPMSLGAVTLTSGRRRVGALGELSGRTDEARRRGERERERVRRHIAGAERGARGRRGAVAVVGLDPLRAINRALLLDELALYRRRGRFPINREARAQVPVFVDEFGTRCAVGHLMEVSGHGELVRHIARTRNNARVRELATLAEVRAWLAAAGLSTEEAARIQPTYCYLSDAEACFCRGGASEAVAVATVVSSGSAQAFRLDRIEGEWPGARVGDERPAIGRWEADQQALLRYDAETGAVSVDTTLELAGGRVYCRVNPGTAERPVSIDTVIEAWRSAGAACIDVLASDESRWNESYCDGGIGADDSDGGCGLLPASGLGAVELTSAALFAMLIARRRQRQRRHGSPG